MLLWCCSSQTPPGALPGWWWRAQYWWVSAPQTWQQEVLGASWGSEPTIGFRPPGQGSEHPRQGSDPMGWVSAAQIRAQIPNMKLCPVGRGSATKTQPEPHSEAQRPIPALCGTELPSGLSPVTSHTPTQRDTLSNSCAQVNP